MNSTEQKSTRMDKVIDFNREVLGIEPRKPGLQPAHEAALSYTQLIEEVREYQEAIGRADYVDCIDAILDGMYFSYGILYKLGLTELQVDSLFDVVHNANMTKVKGIKANRTGFKAADAYKPDGWVDPKITMTEILDDVFSEFDNH